MVNKKMSQENNLEILEGFVNNKYLAVLKISNNIFTIEIEYLDSDLLWSLENYQSCSLEVQNSIEQQVLDLNLRTEISNVNEIKESQYAKVYYLNLNE